jgi:hypothetical protein
MTTVRTLIASFVFIAIAALVGSPGPAEKGAALLAPFKASLKRALIQGMQEGPVNAIEICRDKATEITASLSVEGVTMGRVLKPPITFTSRARRPR